MQVNGELAGYFNSKRGLRQGCALSPYLFVICMEVLSKMLNQQATDRKFGYHPYFQDLKLTHLSFADDMLVFSDGQKQSIDEILETFTKFAEVSGLHISMEKSTLYLAGMSDEAKQEMLSQYTFANGELPIRYLGLALMTKQMSSEDYAPLLEKIRARISSWTACFLSFAGRMKLISSVIFSLANFWISAFRLPKKCIEEIDSLCAAFLWSGPMLNTKRLRFSGKDCCKPKEEGGLGLRSISEANDVSFLKLVWRILSSADSLWVRWIRRYLIQKGSFWSVKESRLLGSWMWKKILKYRDIAAQFAKVEVHSSSSTSFWYDSWSPRGRLIEKTQGGGVLDMGIQLNDTVEKVVNSHRSRRGRGDVYNLIKEEIHNLRTRGLDQREDTRLWNVGENLYKESFSSKET